jgi:hypothetical protein
MRSVDGSMQTLNTSHHALAAWARVRSLAIGAAVMLLAGLISQPVSAEVGDGGDPTAVNLRVSLPSKAKLRPTISTSVRSDSEASGPRPSVYSGTARFGVDRSGPGLVLRSTILKVQLRGETSESGTGRLRIVLSASQRAAIRRAADRAGRESVVLSVVLRGRTPGRTDTSKTNQHFRVRV